MWPFSFGQENFILLIIKDIFLSSSRSNRRYVCYRHIEQQLSRMKLPTIEEKWHLCLKRLMATNVPLLAITTAEAVLMNEIDQWHLNYPTHFAKFKANGDYLIDFEDLIELVTSIPKIPSLMMESVQYQPLQDVGQVQTKPDLWTNDPNGFYQKVFTPLLENVSRQKGEQDGNCLVRRGENFLRAITTLPFELCSIQNK
jgi:hypothetical protein